MLDDARNARYRLGTDAIRRNTSGRPRDRLTSAVSLASGSVFAVRDSGNRWKRKKAEIRGNRQANGEFSLVDLYGGIAG